ncbi:GntR family transcriptional regulator [Salipiger mucosus]|uniref:GntR family transcriptional regulator n=1 Tax=Salipiger mucosus TaxID=263378 RepID=UPI0003686296|nr:GntR family transcriptional regulator [Salipiger mucosus]
MHDPTPLYHRIYIVLREQILGHRFPPDRPMPSEPELSRTFSVSRVTLRRTLERLESEGLIRRERGRGTFATPPAQAAAPQADIRGLVDNLLAMGLRTRVEVLAFDYAPAPHDIAQDMKIAPGTVVQQATRLRSVDGIPFSHAITHVPEDIGRTFEAEDLTRTPLLRLIEASGARISGAHQRVTASAADAEVAALLQIGVGAPLLCITRVVRDADGRALERIRALYRPDMYEFELDLAPDKGPEGTTWQPRTGEL